MDTPQTFTASDGVALALYEWLPNTAPRGIIHVAHGLAEHAGRYGRFATALNAGGWVVYAGDQRGHGQTARHAAEIGTLAERKGWTRAVLDLQELLRAEPERHPGLPLILFGHSMGAYLAQQIIYENSEWLSAAILSGPNGSPSALAQLGRLIARAERLRLGPRGQSGLIDRLTFRQFNRQFQPNRTEFDWLSRDAAEVDQYIADPLCGFRCTTQLWIDLLDGIAELSQPKHKERIRRDLPVYLFAGECDPVCDNGRGALALATAYRQAGLTDVTCRLYPAGRHEMLNEINRDEVISDLLAWLGQHCGLSSSGFRQT